MKGALVAVVALVIATAMGVEVTYFSRLAPWSLQQASDLAAVAAFDKTHRNVTVRRFEATSFWAHETSAMLLHALQATHGPYTVLWTPVGPTSGRLVDELLANVSDVWYEEGWASEVPEDTARGSRNARGTYVSLPLYESPVFLWYQRSRMASLGVSVPGTWEELEEMCLRLIAEQEIVACFSVERSDSIQFSTFFDYFAVWMHGKAFLRQLQEGEVNFQSDPRVSQVMQTLARLIDSRVIGVAHRLQDMFTGDTLFMLHYDGIRGFVEMMVDAASAADLAVSPVPAPATSQHPSLVVHDVVGVSIAKNAQQPEEGRLFARFLATEGMHAFFEHSLSGIPARRMTINATAHQAEVMALRDASRDAAMLSSKAMDLARTHDVFVTMGEALLFGEPVADVEGYLASMQRALEAARIADQFGACAAPDFSVPSGDYGPELTVNLSSITADTRIRFTTDGSFPSAEATVYDPTSGLRLWRAPAAGDQPWEVVVRALATHDSLQASGVAEARYRLHAAQAPEVPVGAGGGGPDVAVVVAAVAAAVVLVLALAALAAWVHVRRRALVWSLADTAHVEVPYEELQVGEQVARGGAAVVYRGLWRGAVVAVKTPLKALDSVHGAARTRMLTAFLREASVLVRVRHPNIVTFMGVCTEPLCLVTEFMARGSLFAVLHSPWEIDPARQVRWAFEICKGMLFLHSAHPPLLHLDLKSLNVLVGPNWEAKIADFGISGFAAPDAPHGTTATTGSTDTSLSGSRNGSRSKTRRLATGKREISTLCGGTDNNIGTLLWAAPEILSYGQRSTAADVYSYAVTLWEIATRRAPFAGTRPMVAAMRVCLEGLRPELPLDHLALTPLEPIIAKCWAQNPEHRPSFAQIADDLTEAFDTRETGTVRDPRLPSTASAVVVVVSVAAYALRALSSRPRLFCKYVRGLHGVCDGLARRYRGAIWKTRYDGLEVMFGTPQDASAFVERLCAAEVPAVAPPGKAEDGTAALAACPLPTAISVCGAPASPGEVPGALLASLAQATCRTGYVVLDEWTAAQLGHAGLRQWMPVGAVTAFLDAAFPELLVAVEADKVQGEWEGQAEASAALSSMAWGVRASGLSASGVSGGASGASPRGKPLLSTTGVSVPSLAPDSPTPRHAPHTRSDASLTPSSTSTDVERSTCACSSSTSYACSEKSFESCWTNAGSPRLPDDADTDAWSASDHSASDHTPTERSEQMEEPWHSSLWQSTTAWICKEDRVRRVIQDAPPTFAGAVWVDFADSTDDGRVLRLLVSQPKSLEDQLTFVELVSTLRQLEHPSLHRIRAACFDPDAMGIWVDAVERRPPRLAPSAVWQEGARLAAGLGYLAEQGVTYGGTLRPACVVWGASGCLLSEFGFQALRDQGMMTVTQDVRYMAPEVLLGDEGTSAADVYSFACVLLEMATQQKVFPGFNQTATAVRVLRGGKPVIPHTLDGAIARFLRACFSRTPTERPAVHSLAASFPYEPSQA